MLLKCCYNVSTLLHSRYTVATLSLHSRYTVATLSLRSLYTVATISLHIGYTVANAGTPLLRCRYNVDTLSLRRSYDVAALALHNGHGPDVYLHHSSAVATGSPFRTNINIRKAKGALKHTKVLITRMYKLQDSNFVPRATCVWIQNIHIQKFSQTMRQSEP